MNLKNLIVWAKDKFDWYDQLIRKEDDFLSDYDFKNLVWFLCTYFKF